MYGPPVALNRLVCASTTWLQLLHGARTGDATAAQLTVAVGQATTVRLTVHLMLASVVMATVREYRPAKAEVR